jgi:hypothetical protein
MPSSAPTRTLQRGTIYNVILNFDDQLPLDGQDVIAVFENITAQYIFERLNETLVQTDGWYDLGVEVFYVKQTIPSTALMASTTNNTDTANTTGTMNGRSGWSTANNANVNPLRIRFDVELSFRSAIYEHDYEVYLVSTLNNQAEQERLIISLQDSNDASFNRINAIKIEVDGLDIFEPDPVVRSTDESRMDDGSSDSLNLAVIVAPVVGVVCAVIFVVGLSLLVKKNRTRNATATDSAKQSNDDNKRQAAHADDDTMGVIEVPKSRDDYGHDVLDDDVSTIGDPLGAFGAGWGGATIGTNAFDDPTVGEK